MSHGLEVAGINLVKRAIELDSAKRYTESLICYQEGLQLLMQSVRAPGLSETSKTALRNKMVEYMDRAEWIKVHIEKEKKSGQYHEQISINENAVGFSYESVMSRFLSEKCERVEVDDPYIRSHHQILNFLRFLEMLVAAHCGVRNVKLRTGTDAKDPGQQKDKLQQIASGLQQHQVKLEVEYSSTLHDREIRFSNNWIIKIGRGLDYFKPAEGKLALGAFNYDLRSCLQTTVDIFFRAPG
ncbi:MIT domain-containing protein 1-like [Watersipora subatra]|uniref:MIT domain-containing protein 1-like n=1 Tax=Watersipora subatra TaxID=2589382 RepID=UPI00355B7A60